MSTTFDAVVIGGGPAGSAISRLLTEWGHSVLVVTNQPDRARGLAESLPPSSRKLLSTVRALDRVDGAGFCRSTGNTVWWGDTPARVERFDDGRVDTAGYQVFRPHLDRLLLDGAAEAGVEIRSDATVRRVRFSGEPLAEVEYRTGDGVIRRAHGRFALDCSGRFGAVARRQQVRRAATAFRTYALVGVWRCDHGWNLPDETQTLVETYAGGWAWSIPVSAAVRQFTVMIDRERPPAARRRGPELSYCAELATTRALKTIAAAGRLERVWGCDASLYTASRFACPQFLLVGDAGSFIDPLSSFGVKKALASAWLGAVVVHTCLMNPDRQTLALDFFDDWERRVYATHLGRSVQYAREAAIQYRSPYWESRAAQPLDDSPFESDDEDFGRDEEVLRAFERLKQAPSINLRPASAVRFEQRGAIREREIVLETTLVAPSVRGHLRFVAGVNLPALVELASRYCRVPDLFEAYCRMRAPIALTDFLGALSVLVAKGCLEIVHV